MSKTKTIELETTFTPWTLDTYQTFTFERAENMEIDHWSRELGLKLDYDDFDWSYDTDGYLQALSDRLKSLLQEYILDDVIVGLEFNEPTSPRQYNFTTDKSFVEWEVDMDKLEKYIEENKEDFEENKLSSGPGFVWLGDEEQTKLNYYLCEESTKLLSKWDAIHAMMAEPYATEFVEVWVKDEVLESAGVCPHCDEKLETVRKIANVESRYEVDLETGEETHLEDQRTIDPVKFICNNCSRKVSEDKIADLERIKQYKKRKEKFKNNN